MSHVRQRGGVLVPGSHFVGMVPLTFPPKTNPDGMLVRRVHGKMDTSPIGDEGVLESIKRGIDDPCG